LPDSGGPQKPLSRRSVAGKGGGEKEKGGRKCFYLLGSAYYTSRGKEAIFVRAEGERGRETFSCRKEINRFKKK